MSQASTAETRHPVTGPVASGALAPSTLRPSEHAGGDTRRVRTPLSVVPTQPRRRRVPLAIFGLLVLAVAFTTILMMNISLAGKQYELVELRNQQVALSQQNEALVQEVEARETPQNLASAATKLGMVSSPSFGTIDLSSRSVTGSPEPAVKGDGPGVLIPAPGADPEPAGPEAGDGEPASPADTTPADVTRADVTPAEGSPAGPAIPAEDISADVPGAGTIPGPQQHVTGR